ncbi:hypothetical protein AAZV13_05G102901 [Glycine max]
MCDMKRYPHISIIFKNIISSMKSFSFPQSLSYPHDGTLCWFCFAVAHNSTHAQLSNKKKHHKKYRTYLPTFFFLLHIPTLLTIYIWPNVQFHFYLFFSI